MFSADTDLQARTDCPASLHCHIYELSDACLVQRYKRILREDALLEVFRQELPRVITAQTQGHLRQVIRAEREEFCRSSNGVRH